MAFENFREPELMELVEDDKSKEWRKLCDELGMQGQIQKFQKKEGVQGKPIPYMEINKKWAKVFLTVCPSKSEYQKYSHSTIPLDALQEIDFCIKNQYFEKIEIWYDNVDKDPFIVGRNKGTNWSDDLYLIGRFGDEIIPLEEIKKKAYTKLQNSLKNMLTKTQAIIHQAIFDYLEKDEDVDIVISKFHGSLYY